MSPRSISISAAKWNCCGGCGKLADENRYTVLVVTHELNLAAEFSDRIVLLHKGKCLRLPEHAAEVYERDLLSESVRGAAGSGDAAGRAARAWC
jgi:ABC-type multidrug transport system ATPase subunit